jgi:hypothetical protein
MKTKNLLLSFLLFFSHLSYAQQINLCDYFSISVAQMLIKGQQKIIVSAAINSSVETAFGKELKEHHMRYDYLITRIFRNDSSLISHYPDSPKIQQLFCEQLKGPSSFRKNLELICPTNLSNQACKKGKFSFSDMMFVASRFFYCNKVNKDTAIIPKICVGINGIKEMNTNKDLAALEAFVFEAIFNSLQEKNEPPFLEDFTQAIQTHMKARIKNIKSIDEFLLQVRNDCFNEMEQNENLKKSLLAYYKKNKSTINFTLQ